MNKPVWVCFSIVLISIHLSPIVALSSSESDNPSNTEEHPISSSQQTSSTSFQSNGTPQTKPSGLPSLTCILFQDFGCNTQCTIVQGLRGFITSGACTSDNVCSCSIKNMPLITLWNKKFESGDVYGNIKNNPNLAEKVQQALQDPSRTAEESAKDLESILPPDQFKKLTLKNIKLTAQPKPDLGKLEKYTVGKLDPVLKDVSELVSKDYKKSLLVYLESNKGDPVIQKVFRQIRQTNNETLQKILVKFLDDHSDMIESKYQNFQDLDTNEVVNGIIINKLIENIEDRSQSQPTMSLENLPITSQSDLA